MRDNARLGAAFLADLLGRSVDSVKSQAKRQRISLRRPGVRRGPVLGQPRGVSWKGTAAARAMREHVLSGVFDVAEAEAHIRAEVQGTVALCPRCTARPQTTRTGLCDACHAAMLAEQHRDAITTLEQRREYNRAKQQKKRLSDQVADEDSEDDDG